jgi:type I restriction enzyme R subunit
MLASSSDAPCLQTMRADKPMQGHGLMQAIARVNRIFRDKPGGRAFELCAASDKATETRDGVSFLKPFKPR